ncbi:uncharacterized protein V1518DRAFT_414223 [Limtongia smithiae]|uniref:uncharacterized protein n=1 Tax=Limtongia smithiae TaxID=1125753 RepID=UPI0034CF2689
MLTSLSQSSSAATLMAVLLLNAAPAAAVTSFCKCTCFTNSTIIRMPSSASTSDACTDCSRKFCLDYNLPICKGAQEKDVSTTCFQRDSIKDKSIVITFLIVAGGLITFAILQLLYARWNERRQYRRI